MRRRREADEGQAGTILLPVLLLLMLIATAATAMTLQARTSLREASTRRLRLTLGLDADAAVRATALALSSATASRAAPPFAIDGTPRSCRLDRGRRLDLAVQDEGGRADLNKATPDLLLRLLSKAVSGSDATALTAAIVARRADGNGRAPATGIGKGPQTGPQARQAKGVVATAAGFATADDLDGLPGLEDRALFERLRPLFTVANGSAGIDPVVAAPAVRAAIPARELSSPALESLTTPSNHSDFTITATVSADAGPRVRREALLHLDAQTGPLGRFATWQAPDALEPLESVGDDPFCRRLAAAVEPAE